MRRLAHRQHRNHTRFGAVKQSPPLVAGSPTKCVGHLRSRRRPRGAIVLLGSVHIDFEARNQLGIELWLYRTDSKVLPVGGFISVIKRCPAVEQIDATLVAPGAPLKPAVKECRQQGRAINHRGIDDLTVARTIALEQCACDSEREQHPAATKVPKKISWRSGT
jgi:hypothetical protein